MRVIQYDSVELQTDSFKVEAPSIETEVTTALELIKELRSCPGMPQLGRLFYRLSTEEEWSDLTQDTNLSELPLVGVQVKLLKPSGIKIQYNAVESQGDSLTSDPADYITQATTVKGLTQELRKRKHMPQTGVILYKTRDQWKTLTEAVEVPENRTLQIKLVKSTGCEDSKTWWELSTYSDRVIWLEGQTFRGARHVALVFFIIALPTVVLAFGFEIWRWGHLTQTFQSLGVAFLILSIKTFIDLLELYTRARGLEGLHLWLSVLIGLIFKSIAYGLAMTWSATAQAYKAVSQLCKKIAPQGSRRESDPSGTSENSALTAQSQDPEELEMGLRGSDSA